jgi:DNA segregation ATPase FtsK/SpoIIIE-like protein
MKTKTLLELLKKHGVHIYDNDEALISEVETEYKNQFSQLPASVTDEQISEIIEKAVHGARNEWTSHDEEENGKGALIKELRSLLNHPPVMGDGVQNIDNHLYKEYIDNGGLKNKLAENETNMRETIGQGLEGHIEQAIEFSKTQEYLSPSLLQRYCKLGYNRAHMVMEQLIERGIVIKPENPTDSRHIVNKTPPPHQANT